MKDTLAATISIAPITSSRCGRSCRGSRRSSTLVTSSAAMPSGMLSQKIADQWIYSERKPPSAGPEAPAVV